MFIEGAAGVLCAVAFTSLTSPCDLILLVACTLSFNYRSAPIGTYIKPIGTSCLLTARLRSRLNRRTKIKTKMLVKLKKKYCAQLDSNSHGKCLQLLAGQRLDHWATPYFEIFEYSVSLHVCKAVFFTKSHTQAM